MDTDSSSSKIKNSLISLKDWKLPASSASDIYNRTGFFSAVRTVEKEIRLSSDACSSFPLFSKFFQIFYKRFFSQLHVGMIQVALKPTKLGSNTSAVIYLCDKRLGDEHSILKTVDSSLKDGPIYFTYIPSYCVSLCSAHHTFTIDIETEESNSMGGSETVILMYRMHYQVTNAFFPSLKNMTIGVAAQRNPPSSDGEESAAVNARVDWKDTTEAHVLKVDVPGLKKEEVRVEVEDDGGTLKISGERRSNEEEEENDGMWHCVERSSGKFLRRVRLPENAKLDEVKAAMEDGVLTVTVPKENFKKKTQVKVIEISG